LLELMIVTVIVAVGVALAVPTYENTMQKRRLTQGVEKIAAFLSLVQSEAIKRNETVAVTVKRNSAGDSWCLGAMIQTAATDHCDCESTTPADADYCDFDPAGAGAPQLINHVGFEKFKMTGAAVQYVTNNDFSFNFDPVRGIKVQDDGTVDPRLHDVMLESDNGKYSLVVDVAVTGRIRVCNPYTAKKVPGFGVCPRVIVLPPPPPSPT
jgi:type IV fimbrial biogenesis protein FimT